MATKKQQRNIFTVILLLLSIAIIALIISLSVVVHNNNSTDNSSSQSSTTTEKVDKSISGKNVEQDKKDALKAAQDLLNDASQSPTKETPQQRAEKLDKNDTSVISKTLPDRIIFEDVFDTNNDLKNNTYQTLIIMSSYLGDAGKIAPLSDDMWKKVYLDSEDGIAYVPVNIFSNSQNVFSIEMVYRDGQWKMSPYSLLEIVKFSASMQNSSTK